MYSKIIFTNISADLKIKRFYTYMDRVMNFSGPQFTNNDGRKDNLVCIEVGAAVHTNKLHLEHLNTMQ